MIKTFNCKETEKVFEQTWSRKFPKQIQRQAMKKLWMLDAANCLATLRVPPSNHLEKLSGTRQEQYSIRVNIQWRICFKWRENHAYEVELVDYH